MTSAEARYLSKVFGTVQSHPWN